MTSSRILFSTIIFSALAGLIYPVSNVTGFDEDNIAAYPDSPRSKGDTFFKANDIALTGDSSALKRIKVLQYYSANYHYYDYPAFRMKLVPANMNFRINEFAAKNRKNLAEQYRRNGINFAGHYSLLWLGKEGENFFESIIVDARNGYVYPAPSAENIGAFKTGKALGFHSGYGFKRASRLLVVNPVDSPGYYNVSQMKNINKMYLWNERFKRFEKLN